LAADASQRLVAVVIGQQGLHIEGGEGLTGRRGQRGTGLQSLLVGLLQGRQLLLEDKLLVR